MLAKEPSDLTPEAMTTWRKIGALTIEDFEEKGIKENICFDALSFKMKKFPFTKKPHIGQADIHSGEKNGIVRAYTAIGGMFEGQFINGKKYGYGREIYADGSYMVANYLAN